MRMYYHIYNIATRHEIVCITSVSVYIYGYGGKFYRKHNQRQRTADVARSPVVVVTKVFYSWPLQNMCVPVYVIATVLRYVDCS